MTQQKQGKFYVTTPIYYPSDNLHIGNAYCTVATDAIARFKRLTGYDVWFLTGTDEHGQKIERKAHEAGVTPQEYVDNIVAGIRELWDIMDISHDDFLRTTEPRHERVVQRIFKRLYDQGDIYKSEYEGWYCTPCESFWTQTQLVAGCCPDCGRNVEKTREECYFLRLSKYAPWLIDYYRDNPDFLQPENRAQEMLKNFLLPGLEDLCVSRTSFKWGIPVSFDEKHVVYVWIDALTNYITALGYDSADTSLYDKFWPADIHIVGKEIVRFHAIIWPIILKALDLPLPKQIYGHGWLTKDGVKMGKSMGNSIDPVFLCERFGVDAIRYFLLREFTFGQDGNYTNRLLIQRINADLANDLGNLLSRTVAMIEKYFDGEVPAINEKTDEDEAIWQQAKGLYSAVEGHMNNLQFSLALNEIWRLVGNCNKYIDATTPWTLAKDEKGRARLATVLYTLYECVRIVAVHLTPFMPSTPERMFEQLGVTESERKGWDSVKCFRKDSFGVKVRKGEALFPRIDVEKELKLLDEGRQAAKAEQSPAQQEDAGEEPLTIDEFKKVLLKTARVIECCAVEGSDKLLKLKLAVGDEERTVVSGIASHYKPEEMIGKIVILAANLAPAKLRGVVSQGMILAAEGDGKLNLLTVDGALADGLTVS